jgi:peptide chain release factor subunit 1
LLEDDAKFGFIVMDGNGTLFGTVSGNCRTVLHKFSVDLPKKHGRGGQSALRFARLRLEKRHNYLRRVAELSTQLFITNDKCNVAGLILAGSAAFKNDLQTSDMFDPRLLCQVIKVVDVSYGGENGFSQAIELSADALANVKFIAEKKLLSAFFAEISLDSGQYCFGVEDTLKALEMGAVERLIVFENLEVNRILLKHPTTAVETAHFFTPEQEKANAAVFRDAASGQDMETVDRTPMLEWLANNYKSWGASLEFVSNKSQEGSQFVKGFSGLGGLLRYKVDFLAMEERPAGDENSDDEYADNGDLDDF